MSKWKDNFCNEFDTTATVKRLTNEIKADEIKKGVEKALSEVIQGKHKRRGY